MFINSEIILTELFAQLQVLDATVTRNTAFPNPMPIGSFLVLTEAGYNNFEPAPQSTKRHLELNIEFNVVVRGINCEAQFNWLLKSLEALISSDRSLGGYCDWIDMARPRAIEIANKPPECIKSALVSATIYYSTDVNIR